MNKSLLHAGGYHNRNNAVDVKLSLIEFEEEGIFFVYSPALDLTGYGKTKPEAKDSYNKTMKEFLRYTKSKKNHTPALIKQTKKNLTPEALTHLKQFNDKVRAGKIVLFKEKTERARKNLKKAKLIK